ncbi:hypothetical protein GGR50DRAFT_697703 [Xylaria sp. CBS 124048]|nr:hypothetical protein GGR50DRAFT_697703 [Xylaria sp. CBS 124048]
MADELVDETSEYHGSVIAFEGPRDILSTQLRLLPSSPKLLVLPPVQSFFSKENAGSAFDARSHILETHEACDARTEIARTFLKGSKPDNKRLVFLNGGTASAHISCIYAISRYETNGDIVAAETLYNELIQNGLASLKRQIKSRAEMDSRHDGVNGVNGEDDGGLDDPISKAMRAADRLDRETAFLQESHELDLTVMSRPRSMSVPARYLAEDLEKIAQFHPFNGGDSNQETPRPGARGLDEVQAGERRDKTATGNQSTDPSAELGSPKESNPDDIFSPTSAKFDSVPGSPVMLGEARLVDIRPSIHSRHRRIRSFDRIYATAITNQDISLCNFPPSVFAKLEERQGPTQSNPQKGEDNTSKKPILRSNFYSASPSPSPIFVKPNRTLVRKKTPPPLNLEMAEPKQPTASHAIQGIDPGRDDPHLIRHDDSSESNTPGSNTEHTASASGSFLNLGDEFEKGHNKSFEAVLPLTEDLVIHFKSEETEPKLQDMIQAFRSGTHPSADMSTQPPGSKGDVGRLDTTNSRGITQPIEQDTPGSEQHMQECSPLQQCDDYDPFAYYLQGPRSSITYSSKHDSARQSQATVVVSTPPTPAQTPPPPPEINPKPQKIFYEFDIRGCKTAVCIQNSLRSILNIYFPPENIGYHQFNFPLLPELSSFWRPVFREIPSGGPKVTRKIDLILAIGAQKRVDKELLTTISGALEKLGRDSNGKSRSGRIDLRYLIANAMQAFTSQPLTSQSQDNPFSNPFLLATLILPHLETYIAAHAATRFLILEYPADHLSTVLALQNLIGVDLLKIAGIVDSEPNEPKSHWNYKQTASHTHTTSAGILTPQGSKSKLDNSEKICAQQQQQPSFSRVNFLLTSTATEFEIATLIASVWRILVDISSSYIPNNNTTNKSHDTNSSGSSSFYPPSSPTSIYSEDQYAPLIRAAVMLGFVPAPEEQLARQQRQQQQQRFAPRPNYVSSGTHADLPLPLPLPTQHRPVTPASSSKASTSIHNSSRTPRSTRTRRNKLRHLLGQEIELTDDDDGVFDGGQEGEDDYYEEEEDEGRLAAEERKYMPLWRSRGVPRRGNTSKALKWLGLAT